MEILNFKAFREICIAFEKRHGVTLKYHPVFDLKRDDYSITPWPGNEKAVVYILADRFGEVIHIGTSGSIGAGLSNYLTTGADGRCEVVKEKWGRETRSPYYLIVYELAEENYEFRKLLKKELRAANDKALAGKPELITVRELFKQVTPERLCQVFPWLNGSYSIQRYDALREILTRIPYNKAADIYRLVVEPLHEFPEINVAIGEVIIMYNMLTEEQFTLQDIAKYNMEFKASLRLPMPKNMSDWQVALAIYQRLFDGKLDPED